MAFINDYLREEEKAKFEEYNVMYPRESDYAGRKVGVGNGRKSCTIDREREMYLFYARNSEDRREYDEYIDYFTLVMVKNNVVSVAYFHLQNISCDMTYHIYWRMCGVDIKLVKNITKEEAVVYLKEALSAYGICGKLGKSTARIGFDF